MAIICLSKMLFYENLSGRLPENSCLRQSTLYGAPFYIKYMEVVYQLRNNSVKNLENLVNSPFKGPVH